MLSLLLAVGTGLLVAGLGCGLVRWVFLRLSLVDRPSKELHKQQVSAVPYGGGFGIALGLIAGLLVSSLLHEVLRLPRGFWALMGGSAGLFLLGLWDDLRPQRPLVKLGIQGVIITLAVVLGDLRINSLGPNSPMSVAAALIWCVLITNAYNLLDHADGITASTAIISATVLASAALLDGDAAEASLWFALMGALGGFLIWNAPPARLYMGDAGSLALGFLIGGGCLAATFWPSDQEGTSPFAVLAPLLVTAIPLYDTAVVVSKRLLLKRPLMRGDRNHITHRLERLGLGAKCSLACVVALQSALASSALLLRLADPSVAMIVLLQAACVLLAVVLMEASRDAAR